MWKTYEIRTHNKILVFTTLLIVGGGGLLYNSSPRWRHSIRRQQQQQQRQQDLQQYEKASFCRHQSKFLFDLHVYLTDWVSECVCMSVCINYTQNKYIYIPYTHTHIWPCPNLYSCCCGLCYTSWMLFAQIELCVKFHTKTRYHRPCPSLSLSSLIYMHAKL